MEKIATLNRQNNIKPARSLFSQKGALLFLLFWIFINPNGYAQTCCPDFVLKDLVEICPPAGACDDGVNADGHHHESIPAACQESVHTYTAYPNDPTIYTYEWTVVGGTPASFTGNPIDIEWGNGNKGYITVVITGTNGCEAIINAEICLIDGPQANFSFSHNPVCENTPVLFTNLSIGGGEYYWDFGDGNYSTAFNPVHSYDAAGVYEVTLTVTDFGESVEGGESATACGCSDSITFTVEVLEGQGPIIESDCCDGTVCPGETSTFYTNLVCTSYNWSVTGGTIIAGAGTSQIVVEWDATYSVPTTVSLETPGCADTPCAGITTVDVPVLYPNLPISGNTNLCQAANETYSIPAMPGTYYTWTVSGGDYSINNSDLNSSHINVSFISPGSFTIEVEYDNPLAGCSGSSSIVVEAKPVFFIFGEALVCEQSAELYVTNGNVSSWLVSPTGPTIDPMQQIAAEITWNNAGTYLITAEAADPSQYCNPTAITQVEVVSPPVLDPIDGPTVVCPDTYLTYFISSDTEGSFFNWSIDPPGSGTIFSEMGADKDSIVVAFHGAGPWTLEVYQETEISPGVTCVSDIETFVVTAQAPPVIISQSNNTTVCVDAIETYTTALPVPQGGFTWEINPPNRGTIVSGQGTEEVEIRWHGPPANATLSVSSCAGADQMQITIVNPPLIDPISADGPTFYCLPDVPNNLTLSTSLDPNFTYQWYVNNQPIPGANTHQYTIVSHPPTPASYIYVVEASNGSCTITREILVVIDDDCNGTPPTFECLLDFSIDPDPACASQPITLNVIVPPATPPAINPGFYQFEWNFGDGSTSFTEVTQKSFDAPGVYDITLIGYNNICTLEVIKQVTVNPLPECTITATDTIFCPGDSLLLEACPGMLGYQWYREGNPIPGATQQTYWAAQHGLYQVEATNQFGCSDLSEGVYIFSHSLPRAKISGDQSLCTNPIWFNSLTFSTPYDPDYSYEWSSSLAGVAFSNNNGNNAASTIAEFQLPNPLPPQISFYVSVTDVTTGCVNTDTLCVTVNQVPYAEFIWQSACEGTPLTLTPSVFDTSQFHYLWNNGATTPEITVSTPGFYVLQITDKFSGCTFNASAGMINPLPDVSLFPTGCETLEVDEVLDLYIPLPLSSTSWNNTIPIAYPNIEWFDTDGNSLGSGENLAFSSSADGYFEVYAVIENVYGCEATTVVFCITVLPKPDDSEPAITVAKTLDSINGTDQTAFTQEGDVLTYNIVVCNTGNVTLFNVVVEDPLTGMSETILELAPGDCETFTTSYTITADDLSHCEVVNVVVATGNDQNDTQVSDTDQETVPCEDPFVPDPDLTVTKTLASINDDPNQTAFTQVGDILTFTIVVTNTGNVPLTNVLVDDPVTGDSWTIPVLNPGDSQTFTTTYTITQGEIDSCVIRNVVNATGDDPDGNQLGDMDVISIPCDPEENNPGVSIQKTLISINDNPDQTTYNQVGDVLTYALVITNTGNVTLTNLTVNDPFTGFSTTIATLAPGDSVTFTTSYTIQQADIDNGFFNNRATVSGVGPDGTPIADTDFEIVEYEEMGPVLYDFGDAPEGALAYPPFITGNFPTCMNTGVDGSFVRHGGDNELFFGEYVDYETDGNAGFCPTFSPNLYDQDECFQDGDAGLIRPRAYTIIGNPGNETVVPCVTGGPRIPWFPCRWARWKTHIDIHVTNNLPGGTIAYANLLIDWNQDGEWGGSSICRNMDVPEHVLVNFEIPNGFSGPLSDLSPPDFRIGPNRGYIWTRFTVSEVPVPTNWNGAGDFEYGETEDYLLHVRSPFVIVDAWDLIDIVVPLDVDTCFSATQTLRLGGEAPFVVEDGGAVDLRAGRSIRMLEGMKVEAGGFMHARIVTDPDDYCFVEEMENTQSKIINPIESTESKVSGIKLSDKYINIYPNPTNGQLTLELLYQPNREKIRVEVFNMMGEKILITEVPAEGQHVFDLSGQPKGIYFIRVIDGQTPITKRIIRH